MTVYTDNNDEELDQLRKLQDAYRRTLGILQIQMASYGPNSIPVSIQNDHDQTTAKLLELKIKIDTLQRAQSPYQTTTASNPQTIDMLRQVSVVPQTISEQILALAMRFEAAQFQAGREFQALHRIMQTESEARHSEHTETRRLVEVEHGERVKDKEADHQERVLRQLEINRWFLVVGGGLLVLFLLFVFYVVIVFLREYYLAQSLAR